jgi:hypothetical protein
MDILEHLGWPIYSPANKDLYDIELYEFDTSKLNIYYASTTDEEKNFLIEIKNDKLTQETLRNLSVVKNSPHRSILSPLYIFKKSENLSYLCFEFLDIKLSDYINYALPNLKIRINLMKQFVEMIIHFHNNKLPLDDIDINYLFIDGLDSPVLKILYHGNFYIIN